MLPVLLEVGPITISAFGFFLSLGLLVGTFVIFRLAKVYDLDWEKTLDLIFLTFAIGFIGSRIFFVLTNLSKFSDIFQIILFNRYPGLSLWGALIFGSLSLYFLTKRLKMNFFLIADVAIVGLFAGLVFGSLGCLLSSCQVGVPSNGFLAVAQAGFIEKRFPIQVIYAIAYLIVFFYLWKMCLRFHFAGKVLAVGFIALGLIRFFGDFYRGETQFNFGIFSENHLISLFIFLIGVMLIYSQGNRKISNDLAILSMFLIDSKSRNLALLKLKKSWYNHRVNWKVSTLKLVKLFTRKLNVKENPPKY